MVDDNFTNTDIRGNAIEFEVQNPSKVDELGVQRSSSIRMRIDFRGDHDIVREWQDVLKRLGNGTWNGIMCVSA